MDDDEELSQGGLNPAGFTPNYGWPVKSRERAKKQRRAPTGRIAFGWVLTAVLVAGIIVALVWAWRGSLVTPQ